MKKDHSKWMLSIKIVLAIIGFSILMINHKISRYGLSNYADNVNIKVAFMVLGILLMLPIFIHIIRSK